MKIRIRAAGGLGNQLLQYFGALFISQVTKERIIYDLSDIDSKHTLGSYDLRSFVEPEKNLKIPKYARYHLFGFALRLLRKLTRKFNRNFIFVTHGENREDIQSLRTFLKFKPRHLFVREFTGWFANFDYFFLLPENQRRLTLKSRSERFLRYEKFLSGQNYVAVHFRFGDYMENPSIYGVLTHEYYERALEALNVSIEENYIVFFTNDNSKLEEFLDLSKFKNFLLIDDDPEFDPAEVMVLMAGANKIVTSNSTFSYMAGLLAPSATIAFPRFNVRGEEFILNTPSHWIEIQPSWL